MTAGGKNVAPAVLEDRLRAHRLISQCIVVGDQRPFIAALITLDEEALPAWLESKGKPEDHDRRAGPGGPGAARRDRARRSKDANKAVSQAEAIKKFTHPRHGLHRGQRDADPEPEAQARRRHEGVRRRGRGALQPLSTAAQPARRSSAGRSVAAIVVQDQRCSTQARPGRAHRAAPGPGRRAGRRSRAATRRATRGSTTWPVTPSCTASGAPPESPATTGRPQAAASRKTMPSPSTSSPPRRVRHGMANTSPAA